MDGRTGNIHFLDLFTSSFTTTDHILLFKWNILSASGLMLKRHNLSAGVSFNTAEHILLIIYNNINIIPAIRRQCYMTMI